MGTNEFVQEEFMKSKLRFVDKDIRDAYFIASKEGAVLGESFDPLVVQLSRDIKNLTTALRAFKAELDDPTV